MDFSPAREDSSSDVEEDEQGRLKEMLRKRVVAERLIRELNEEIAKDQAVREKQVLEPVRTDRKVILKEPAAMSAAVSKKRPIEDKEGDSKQIHRVDSYNRMTFRMRGSPFTEEILSDPMPMNFRPIPIEYDGKDDPEAHMSRFEGLMTLHQYSEGIKCKIFSTTLMGAAHRWFQQLGEESITCFEDMYTASCHILPALESLEKA